MEDIDEIWGSLKNAFGDLKVMLSKKFADFNNIATLLKSRDAEKISDGLNKIINLMKDLMKLAEQHKISEKLHHGDGLERIFKVLGESRVTRWVSQNDDRNLESKEYWDNLIIFLEKEMKIHDRS